MKTCSKCKIEKPVSSFHKHARSSDGIRGQCKTCNATQAAAYYTANAPRLCAKAAAHRAAHPEVRKTYNPDWAAAYRQANSEALRVSLAAWRAANPGAIKEYSAAYRQANSEALKVSLAAYRQANSEALKVSAAAWRAAHPEAKRVQRQNRRARKLKNGGQLPKDIIQRLFTQQNGWCTCCGADLAETGYHLDHILALAKEGPNTEDNVQLLTPKCNMEKGTKDWEDRLNSRWQQRNT